MAKTELILKFKFEASHSLEKYEAAHPHLWDLEVVVTGTPKNGMIVDLVPLRERTEELIAPIRSTFLNEHPRVSEAVRKAPTCETLSDYFAGKLREIISKEFVPLNSTIRLDSVLVAIYEMDGTEAGAVRLREV